VIPLAAAALTLLSLLFLVRAWAKGYWSVGGRMVYSLVALAAVAFLAALRYWNLLG